MELLVTYHLKKESAEEFLRKLGEIGIPGLVRGERGCIRYDYYVPRRKTARFSCLMSGRAQNFRRSIWNSPT